MYEVSFGTSQQAFNTRQEAISAARELSKEHRGVIAVTDPQGRERLTYQAGTLVTYDYETRVR